MLLRLETSVRDLKKGREDNNQSTVDWFGDLQIKPRSKSFGVFCSNYEGPEPRIKTLYWILPRQILEGTFATERLKYETRQQLEYVAC